MAAEIDFQPYLRSLSKHYAQWWQLYTLTDAETRTEQSCKRSRKGDRLELAKEG
ncbi:MAG: hypothetical protein MH252_18110 [Thermosynechococcaceae cyanobacterium MS004]|nr:hypothetical protein [Thermosynechococcaceae cyanobacterium MS004]